jgi:hypothetical protein
MPKAFIIRKALQTLRALSFGVFKSVSKKRSRNGRLQQQRSLLFSYKNISKIPHYAKYAPFL